jgi:predicted extracellular nuclease
MNRVPVLLGFLLALLAVVTPTSAVGASSGLVISQLYAGGGNAGATYTNDFVELFNPGASSVDLSSWTIQYASAASASWSATPLVGSIAPGRYYLVQLASTAAVGAALPAPDATGTTNLAASGGKVALVQDATVLTCGASAGSCSAASSIRDLVGYGGAADYEGSGPAPALSSTTAAQRAAGGCTDSGDNASDFTSVAPQPRNSAAAAVTCSGSPPPSGSASQGAQVDVDVQSLLSISLERSTLSFGQVRTGTTPSPLSEAITVGGNVAAGYSLDVHRSAFAPADLPLGIAAAAPAGGQVGPGLAGGARVAVPVTPAADLVVGTTSGPSAPAGDVWPATLGFTAALPSVPAGRYSAAVTFTVLSR